MGALAQPRPQGGHLPDRSVPGQAVLPRFNSASCNLGKMQNANFFFFFFNTLCNVGQNQNSPKTAFLRFMGADGTLEGRRGDRMGAEQV